MPKYYRFVDDIIIFNCGEEKNCIKGEIKFQIEQIGLELNEGKTVCKSQDKIFENLGYKFDLPKISVRNSSVEKFIDSIASMVYNFKNYLPSEVKKYKWLDEEAHKRIFIERLNEKITGAISENRRYGWLFYFMEINDEGLLHRMDRIIESFFYRLSEFKHERPHGLKRLARAYFEAKHNSHGYYIHNYNRYDTLSAKIEYLNFLGKLNPESEYSHGEIIAIFEKTKTQNLSYLENDVGEIY